MTIISAKSIQNISNDSLRLMTIALAKGGSKSFLPQSQHFFYFFSFFFFFLFYFYPSKASDLRFVAVVGSGTRSRMISQAG